MRRWLVAAVVAVAALTAAWAGPAALRDPQPPAKPAPPPVLRYVALGDSLATGTGAERGYPAYYRRRLAEHTGARVVGRNLARDGATSGDLLADLRDDDDVRDAVASADVVTFDIGGNDLLGARLAFFSGDCDGTDCVAEVVDDLTANWDAIASELAELRADGAMVVTMDLYNPFAADLAALGVLELLAPHLDAVNAHIAESARAHGFASAGVYASFNADGADPVAQGLIADDRLHPSDAGHRRIAALLPLPAAD